METTDRIAKNILYTAPGCAGHKIHRVFVSSVKEDEKVGNIYAVHYVTHLHSHQVTLLRTLWHMVDDELEIFDGRIHPVDPRHAQHLSEIISHTILRERDHVRARVEDGFSLVAARDEGVLNARIEKLQAMITGDPRANRLVHHEIGCCGGMRKTEDIKRNVYSALVESGLMQGLDAGNPSAARWGTTTKSMASQAAGNMICSVLPRAVTRSFVHFEDGDLDDAEANDDFRRYVKGKVWRTTRYLAEVENIKEDACISFCSEPLDHLLRRLEYMDEHKNAALDLMKSSTNPFHATCLKFAARLTEPLEDGDLSALIYHWARLPEDLNQMKSYLRKLMVSMDAQVWSRLLVFYDEFPWRFAILVHGGFSNVQREALVREFYEKFLCCLEPDFATKVHL